MNRLPLGATMMNLSCAANAIKHLKMNQNTDNYDDKHKPE